MGWSWRETGSLILIQWDGVGARLGVSFVFNGMELVGDWLVSFIFNGMELVGDWEFHLYSMGWSW